MFRLLRFSAALWIIPATCGADLKVLDAPADLVFHARGGPYRLHLRAEGGGLTDVQGQVSAVRLLNGKENIPSALELQGPLASIGAGQIAYYSFQPRAELLPSPGTYRAMLLLHYRDGNLAKALTVTLDLQLPPATVTPVQDPPLRLLLRRSIPFTQASGTARALLQSNDREVRLVLPSEGTLTVIQGKSKVLHPDAWVRAVEGGGGNRNHMAITLEAAIPAGFTRGEGKLRVVTAPAQADQFIAVEAYVRDGPLAPISVLVCFHLLAYLINRYIRVTRPAQALRAQVLHVEGELNELLSVQPELTDRQETRELRSAIRKAQARLDEPDLAAAQAALAEALALLETLRRMNMQEGAPFAQPLDPEITVGGPMGEISPAAPARLLLQGVPRMLSAG
ncbi:MAG: hypothetical protein IPJ98_31055 [Bryobacterales bacterium]|nr:hypothetical protein [Bryobacterales bacterium]